jgi:chaperonin GroEL
MSAKQILFDEHARAQIARGVDALANVVKVTLGPRGRLVLVDQAWGAPSSTKDGATVANEIELEDRFQNLGVQMIREVAAKTAEVAGDGTTTATVLAQAIFTEGAKLVAAGIDPMGLKRGMDLAVTTVVAELARIATPIRGTADLAQVAILSSNGDKEIGSLIAAAMEKLGNDAVITIEETQLMETTLEIVDGMRLERGYLSPYFITDPERMEAVLDKPYILLAGSRLTNMQEMLPLLEQIAHDRRPLLIIAEEVAGEALATLVVNKLRKTLAVCAITAPGFGDGRIASLHDLAALTGGRAITSDLGLTLAKVVLADLGQADTVTVTKDSCTIIQADRNPALEPRIQTLQHELAEADDEDKRLALRTRIARLTRGVGVLKLGASSELEMKEKKARIEDALHATRAAAEEGVVPGGGLALLRCTAALAALSFTDDRRHGVEVIRRALQAPMRQLVANAGVEAGIIVEQVLAGTGAYGYNVATNAFEDLTAAGIIDPTKVVRVALQNAVSVASIMLTTEAAIVAL